MDDPTSLPNYIRAPLPANPHLVHPRSIDIDPLPDAVRRLLRLGVARVGDGQLAREDEVRRQAGVGVRRVVRVPRCRSAVRPKTVP